MKDADFPRPNANKSVISAQSAFVFLTLFFLEAYKKFVCFASRCLLFFYVSYVMKKCVVNLPHKTQKFIHFKKKTQSFLDFEHSTSAIKNLQYVYCHLKENSRNSKHAFLFFNNFFNIFNISNIFYLFNKNDIIKTI